MQTKDQELLTELRTKIAQDKVQGNAGLDDLSNKIRVWGIEKGIHKSDSRAQFLKVVEELGEIAAALARGDEFEFKDAVGDTFVTLDLLALGRGYTMEECVGQAYDVIKGRTGQTVDGIFLKSEDIKE